MSRGRRRLAALLKRAEDSPARGVSGNGGGPAVSIVLPIYNVEEYLAECLDSIAAQSFTDYELLVVDDGSPDGSRAIAERYAAGDDRIRIIVRENGGLGAARNTGIREAAGTWLTFVDSDDKLTEGALEALVSSATQSGSDIVCGAVTRFDGYTSWSPDWVAEVHRERLTSVKLGEFLPLIRNLYTWNKLFRRDFWDSCGLWFREGVAYEDQPIITQLFAAAGGIDVLPEVVYSYRVRLDNSSISQQVGTMRDLRDRISAWEETREALLGEGLQTIYEGWLQTLLDAHFHWYLGSSMSVSDDYWTELRRAIVDFLGDAPQRLWQQAMPNRRVILELVRLDRREDVQRYVDSGGRNLHRWPATPHDGGLRIDLPFQGDPDLDEALFLLGADQVRVVSRVDWLRWTDVGCEITGWAFLGQVDLSGRESTVEVVLTNDRTGAQQRVSAETGLALWHRPPDTDDPGDHTGGSFRVTLPWQALTAESRAGDSWSAGVLVEVEGVQGSGPLDRLHRQVHLQAVGAGPGLRISPEADLEGRLKFRLDEVRLDLTRVHVSGRTVSISLGGPAVANLSRMEMACPNLGPAVSSEPDESGLVWFELPPLPAGAGRATWRLTAYRSDGGRLGGSLSEDAWSNQVYADSDSGLEVRRTIRNGLAVRQWSVGAVAESVELHDDELVISGRVFGDVLTVALVVPSVARPGPAAPVADACFEARLPLEQEAWRFGRLPLPLGDHELSIELTTGENEPVLLPLDASELLASAPPHTFSTALVEGRLLMRPGGPVRLTILRPLGPDRAPHVQQALRSMPARALTPGLLLPGGRAGLSLLDELRRRGSDLPVWWGVTDHAQPVPGGVEPVIQTGRRWYELLASVSHVIDESWRPVLHDQPTGQIYVELGSTFPVPPLGVEQWRLAGLARPLVRRRIEQVARWHVLVSPSPAATKLLRESFQYDGRVLEIGSPRNDLLAAGGETLRNTVRSSLGITDGASVVLLAAELGPDLADLRSRLPEDVVLLSRERLRAPLPGVVDVSRYPLESDLLIAADCAVLDHSALRFDAAAGRLPMVFHVGDEPCVDPWPLPGPITRRVGDLAALLADPTRLAGAEGGIDDGFRMRFLALEDGHASVRLLDAILD